MHSFQGGIHPKEEKLHTAYKPIEPHPIPGRVIIPFLQHTGTPSKPIVAEDDLVKVGTMIGESGGRISVPTHATISGRITEIKEYPHPLIPKRILSCVIEGDGKEEWDEHVREREDYLSLTRDELLSIIHDAGIVGLGGAAFPTHVKLSPPQDKPIDTLILNGCECEPYLTADHRLMVEKPHEIVAGAEIFERIVEPQRVIIAIEENKPDAISAMNKTILGLNRYRVVVLKTKYPQGAEKQLIKAILKREVPSGGLPMDVRTLVQNVGTALAAYEAVRFGRPLIERVVTVTGSGIKTPKNLRVRIGTPLKDLVESCGGFQGDPLKVIMGGPLMGIAQFTVEDIPVIKGMCGILVQSEKDIFMKKEGPCLRCARCVDICPMGLLTSEISALIENRKLEEAEKLGLFDCIECGCCAYVCPANRHLVHFYKFGKLLLTESRKR